MGSTNSRHFLPLVPVAAKNHSNRDRLTSASTDVDYLAIVVLLDDRRFGVPSVAMQRQKAVRVLALRTVPDDELVFGEAQQLPRLSETFRILWPALRNGDRQRTSRSEFGVLRFARHHVDIANVVYLTISKPPPPEKDHCIGRYS